MSWTECQPRSFAICARLCRVPHQAVMRTSTEISEPDSSREASIADGRSAIGEHRRVLHNWLPPLLIFIAIVVGWQAIPTAFGVPIYVFPTATEVLSAVGSSGSVFWSAVVTSAVVSAIGLGLSAVLGVGAGCAMATWKPVELTLYPYMVIMYTVPIIAIAPIIIVWFGPGETAILIITVIVGFFPVVTSTVVGLQSASATSVELFRICGATKFQTLWKLRLPGALPYIVSALKVTASLAVVGAIIGEYVAGTSGASGGLGYVVIVSATRLETSLLFASAIASGLLGVLFFVAVSLGGNRVLRSWHESAMKP